MPRIIPIICLLGFTSVCLGQDDFRLMDWTRAYFEKPLFEPFIFYVIYGEFDIDFRIPKDYRTSGIPDGIELMGYGPDSDPEVLKSFLEGYLWDDLRSRNPNLAKEIEASPQCFVIRGSVDDGPNLNYLRDVVGIATYLLDNGGVTVYDPQMFNFWTKGEWKKQIFEENGPVPRNHVTIIVSEEETGTKWFHTRGMRKFGRPDLSIHGVSSIYENAVIDLFDRFIEFEGFGGIIADKQPIRISSLPEGMWCENRGDFEDPDFNNKHVEIHWK